jgi:hypothetical protein
MNRIEKFKLLYNSFYDDTERTKNRNRMNHWIEELEDFKDRDLKDKEWAEDLAELDKFGTRFYNSEPSRNDLHNMENQIKIQLDKIQLKLHLSRGGILGAKQTTSSWSCCTFCPLC